jgi:hypothetical protein
MQKNRFGGFLFSLKKKERGTMTMMVNIFGKNKEVVREKTEDAFEKKPLRRDNSSEMKELRQMEFVWNAYDTNSKKKSGDWYFILWTIALSGAVAAVLLDNVLFGLFLVIAAFSVSIYASRKPKMVEFSVTRKGVRADTLILPFSTLTHFYIAEESMPMYLLLQSKKTLVPLYAFPIAEEVDIENLHTFLANFLEEEVLETPLYQRIMDRIGF